MLIGDSIWIILITTNYTSYINWSHSFTCLTTFLTHSDTSRRDVLIYNSTPVAKVTRRRRRSIWWWFWTYFVVNTFDTKLLSHVFIGINHGRLCSRDVPAPDKNLLWYCYRNSLPTVINPLIKIDVKHKKWKTCSLSCQTYKPTIISNLGTNIQEASG